MSKKNLFLTLAILGFAAPNILVLEESIETGNILLYANLIETFSNMFANRISTIFAIDLLFTVMVFFIWTYQSIKIGSRKIWIVWVSTMLFGLVGGFPLYPYFLNRNEEL